MGSGGRTAQRARGSARWAVPVFLVGGTVVGLLRLPPRAWGDVVWAEDGSIFLAQAEALGPAEAIGRSYAGYAHLVPRLLAEVAAALPVAWAAVVFSLAAALVTAAAGALVYDRSAVHLASVPARLAVSVPVLAVYVGIADVPLNVANLHWVAMYASFWVLVTGSVGTGRRVVGAVTLFLTAASDPLTALLVPLTVPAAIAFWRGDRRALLQPVGLALGLLFQVVVRAGGTDRELGQGFDPAFVVISLLARALPTAVLGDRIVGTPGPGARYLVAVAVAALVIAGIALVAWRSRAEDAARSRLAAVAAIYAVAFYVAPVALSGVATPRYATVPALLLVTASAIVLDRATLPSGALRAVRVAALGALAVAVVVGFPSGDVRNGGPSWSGGVRDAVDGCSGDAEVPLAPSGWTAELPCAALDG